MDDWGTRTYRTFMEYRDFVTSARNLDLCAMIEYFRAELKYKWICEYERMTPHPLEIVEVVLDTFAYVFDLYSQTHPPDGAEGAEPSDGRLVAAFGSSKPPSSNRESSRLRGWIGPTEKFLGPDRDKGHFIAHTIGGHVDRFEINVFSQLRHVNRGWSDSGKLYRRMEQYCARNPGTFCFARPFYDDQTCRPSRLEFGILRADRTLWVEEFPN